MKELVLGVAMSCSNGTCAATPQEVAYQAPIRTHIVQPVVQTPIRVVRKVRTNKPVRTLVKRIFCR